MENEAGAGNRPLTPISMPNPSGERPTDCVLVGVVLDVTPTFIPGPPGRPADCTLVGVVSNMTPTSMPSQSDKRVKSTDYTLVGAVAIPDLPPLATQTIVRVEPRER